MDDGAEFATAGLVVAFAAVLLVASHFFVEARSAKQLVKGSDRSQNANQCNRQLVMTWSSCCCT